MSNMSTVDSTTDLSTDQSADLVQQASVNDAVVTSHITTNDDQSASLRSSNADIINQSIKSRPHSLSISSSAREAAAAAVAAETTHHQSNNQTITHIPTSKSFDTSMTPQSPTPMSPLALFSSMTPVEPSRPASHRLVDYFLVIGRKPDPSTSLVPMRRLSRSNSQTIQPIIDLAVVTGKEVDNLSDDYVKITDFSGHEINVNGGGFMRTPVYVAESRHPKPKPGGGLTPPITGIDVLLNDKKETPRAGYSAVPGNLSKGAFNRNVMMYIERDINKSPIIDVKLLCVTEAAPNKDKNASGLPDLSAAIEACPPDYTLVDKLLGNHRGKDYYLCYKVAVRRAVEYMAYESFVLDRFPPTDHFDQALEAEGVAMLCFPRGMILTSEMTMPSFMTFVITQADGSEMYGAALIFYEQLADSAGISLPTPKSPALLSPPRSKAVGASAPNSSDKPQVWCPKCLCLLSHHPYYDVYKAFLNQLYRIAVSPSSLPIERYLANFFYDVPVPTPLYPVIRFTMGHEKITLRLNSRLGLPHQHVSLMPLFKCMSLPNIISIFEHVLAEGKCVLVSSSYTLLTPVAEAIRALIFPFKWQCVFIPILPTNLAYTIRAPVPFIVGLHRSFLDEIKVPGEVLQVDLDRNRITMPTPSNDPDAEKEVIALPLSLRDQLHSHLESFADIYRPPDEHSNNELDSYTAPLESTDAELTSYQELGIRLSFLRVIIRFMGEYRRYCILREEDDEDEVFDLDRLFDRKSFFASFPPALVSFARQMTDTQGFSDFILNRVSFTTRCDELLFFDYCCALTRENTSEKKEATASSETKPPLQRAATVQSPTQDPEKRRFARAGRGSVDITNQSVQSSQDQYRTGSLTIEKIEEWQHLYPSLTPFLYAPGHEKPYVAPPVDESDCPPVMDEGTFPTLDINNLPEAARELLRHQQEYAVYHHLLEKQRAAAKKAAKAATVSGRPEYRDSPPVASPAKVKSSLTLDHLPSSPKANRTAIIQPAPGTQPFAASLEDMTQSREKIVLAMFTLLNSLIARASKSPAEEKKASTLAASVYAMWFTLFVSECEKERAKRILAQQSAEFERATDSDIDPLRQPSESPFSPESSVVKLLPDREQPMTAADLLSIYTELHTMVYKGSVQPNELILLDISLFCLRAGLTREFQELYRLLSTSVPFPTTSFFVTLAKTGVSMLPDQPCSNNLLVERSKQAKLELEQLNQQLSFPTTIETVCICVKCDYPLSGEEIVSSWAVNVGADKLQCSCPMCEALIQPSLLVKFVDRDPIRVDYFKPTSLRGKIRTLTTERREREHPEHGLAHEDVVDLGDSGTVDLFNTQAAATVITSHDYLLTIKTVPELFWNCFWYFVSRGLNNEDYGQLPIHFFFGEMVNSPSHEQPTYRFVAKPYRPWSVTQDGLLDTADSLISSNTFGDGSMMFASGQSSRSVSPTLHSSMAGINEALSRVDDESRNSCQSSPSNGHRGIHNDDMGVSALTLSGDSTDFSDEFSKTGEILQSLEASSMQLRDRPLDQPTSVVNSVNSTPLAPSRRHIKNWAGIVAIMNAASESKKSAVPRAVHEILRARKARRSWSDEQKEADIDSARFAGSMYRALATLLTDTTDPVGFAAEYQGAIKSLDSLIENHKKAVESVDAQMAQLTKTGQDKNSNNQPATIPESRNKVDTSKLTSNGSSNAIAIPPASPASGGLPGFDSPSPSPLSRSPSSSAVTNNLDPESLIALDAARKKRNQLIATLQEAISLRNEIRPCDTPPNNKYVSMIPAVRRVFAHDHTTIAASSARSTTRATDSSHAAYASLVEHVLLNEVPELEDVLSQSSQNPYYTLDGFQKFCVSFTSQEEKDREALARQLSLQASLSSAAAALSFTMPPPTPRFSKPAQSLAYRYCTFWQTARKWKIGYEKQEKQRSISMAMKNNQQEMIQDVLFDTAKAIYLEYLVPVPITESVPVVETDNAAPGSGKILTITGFEIDQDVFGRLKQALGDITTTKTGTPVNRSTPATSDPPKMPLTPTGSNSSPTSSSKSTIVATITKRRVQKTLFDELLDSALSWLQTNVMDAWVHEVKESEHSLMPAQLGLGVAGLHNHAPTSTSASKSKSPSQPNSAGKPPQAPSSLKALGKSMSSANVLNNKK